MTQNAQSNGSREDDRQDSAPAAGNTGAQRDAEIAPVMTRAKLVQSLVTTTLLFPLAGLIAYLIMGEKFHDVIGGPIAHTRNVFIFLCGTFVIVMDIAIIIGYAKSKGQRM